MRKIQAVFTKSLPWLCLFAAILIISKLLQPHGLGATPDSVNYIIVAKNFALGLGITDNAGNLVNHWPPGYPILLGIASSISGSEILEIGVLFNIAMLMLMFVAFVLCAKKIGLNDFLIAILSLFLLSSKPIGIYRFFWSEVLFLPLLLLGTYFVLKWIRIPQLKYLFYSGICCGLLLFTRYAGIGFIAGFLIFLLIPNKNLLSKLKNIMAYLLPIFIGGLLWLFYTQSFDQGHVNREINLHFIPLEKIEDFISTIEHWFIYRDIPFLKNIPYSLLLILALGLLLLVGNYYKQLITIIRQLRKELLLLISLLFCYCFFLMLSISLFDAFTPINDRILAPIFPILILVLGILFKNYSFQNKQALLSLPLVALLLFSSVYAAFPYWKNHYLNGSAYTSKKHKESETLKAVIELSDGKKIYSNGKELILLYTSNSAELLPYKFFPVADKNNPNYLQDQKAMKKEIEKGRSKIVYFNKIQNRKHLMSKDEMLDYFAGFDIEYFEDGFLIQ